MFDKLNKKLLEGKKTEATPLTPIFQMIREFGGLGDILGRDFEVYDTNDKLKYKIVQKPIKITQLNILLEELGTIMKLEAEASKSKNGNVNKGRRGK